MISSRDNLIKRLKYNDLFNILRLEKSSDLILDINSISYARMVISGENVTNYLLSDDKVYDCNKLLDSLTERGRDDR